MKGKLCKAYGLSKYDAPGSPVREGLVAMKAREYEAAGFRWHASKATPAPLEKCPVVNDRGERFESASAAAKAYKMGKGSIFHSVRTGRPVGFPKMKWRKDAEAKTQIHRAAEAASPGA